MEVEMLARENRVEEGDEGRRKEGRGVFREEIK